MARLSSALTLRGRSLLTAGVALLLCGIALGFRDITRIGVLVGALPLLASTLTASRRLQISATRSVTPGRVHVDETCDVVLTVTNTGRRMTPVIMAEEELDYALGDRPRFVIPAMGAGVRHQLRYRLRSTVRGRHHLGPLALRIKDPFDLTTRHRSVPGPGELIVLPRVVTLHDGDASGGTGHEGNVAQMIALHGEDDVSVRQYRDGDDLRRIHWPATARTGDLMVRQEDRPARRRAVILLDDRNATTAGPRSAGSFEWAVSAAASLANHFLAQGLTTHLVHAGERLSSPDAPETALEDTLEALALAERHAPEVFSRSVEEASDIASNGAFVAAIIAPLGGDVLGQVARVRAPGSRAVALVLDVGAPLVAGGPSALETAKALRDRGWSSIVVGNGLSVPQAWGLATTSMPVNRR